jgi:hypothetical protein
MRLRACSNPTHIICAVSVHCEVFCAISCLFIICKTYNGKDQTCLLQRGMGWQIRRPGTKSCDRQYCLQVKNRVRLPPDAQLVTKQCLNVFSDLSCSFNDIRAQRLATAQAMT